MSNDVSTTDLLIELQDQVKFLHKIPALLLSNSPGTFTTNEGRDVATPLYERLSVAASTVAVCFNAYADIIKTRDMRERRRLMKIVLVAAESIMEMEIETRRYLLQILPIDKPIDIDSSYDPDELLDERTVLYLGVMKIFQGLHEWLKIRVEINECYEWLEHKEAALSDTTDTN